MIPTIPGLVHCNKVIVTHTNKQNFVFTIFGKCKQCTFKNNNKLFQFKIKFTINAIYLEDKDKSMLKLSLYQEDKTASLVIAF